MTRLDRIEQDIASLSPGESAEFRAWFEEFEAQRFDEAVVEDARTGKLDALGDAALAEFRAGKSRPL